LVWVEVIFVECLFVRMHYELSTPRWFINNIEALSLSLYIVTIRSE
jgi:hypothetical protein